MSKTRALKSWSKRNLPDDLWPEILSRLPVKSLLQFRSVSRSWKLMIDAPHFTRLHLNRFNNFQESRLFFVQGPSYECVVKNNKTLRTNCSLGFLQSDLDSAHVLRSTPVRGGGGVRRWSILSSIDGLFMLKESFPSVLMLWNPSIRKTLTVPPPPEIPQFHGIREFGLGFDPVIQDYKFVQFVIASNGGVHLVAIYTIGTNSWKVIEYQGEERQYIMFNNPQRSTTTNGVLFALAKDISSPLRLVSFDLRSEVFAFTKLPVVYGPENPWAHQALTMVDDGSSLALVNVSKLEGSMWRLERLGDDVQLWNWICCYAFSFMILANELHDWELKFLWLKKNGEMLLKWGTMVVCYNLETQQETRMLEKNRKNLHAAYTLPYIKSLLLH